MWVACFSEGLLSYHYGAIETISVIVTARENESRLRCTQSSLHRAANIPILGEGRDHMDVARYVLEGYQVINH